MLERLKKSIGLKVLLAMLAVSMAGLLVCIFMGIGNMLRIRDTSIRSSHALGTNVANRSEEALTQQMKQNIQTLAENKSQAGTDVTLGQYLDYVQNFAYYLHLIMKNPEQFLPQPVSPFQQGRGLRNTIQLNLENGIVQGDIQARADLLGNIKHEFAPVMANSSGVITAMYAAMEDGFMLSYDKNPDQTGTYYFPFKTKNWYETIKREQKAMFVEVYRDSMGNGLMTTCGAPVYDAQNNFAGVVCIDMRLEDIYQDLIDVDISKNAEAFLIDQKNRVIAGRGVDYTAAEFSDVSTLDPSAEFAAALLDFQSGTSGVLTVNDMFYAYAPVDYVNWVLMIRVPKSDVIQPVEEMRKEILNDTEGTKAQVGERIAAAIAGFFAVVAVSAGALVFVAWKFTRKLVSPVVTMQNQVRLISQGNLDLQVSVDSQDEIGELAREFNGMTASLKRQMNEIREVTAEKERIGAELAVATQIQASMLPSIFPPFPDRKEFDIFASMHPAKEVGGDFYDFFLIDENHLAVVMADVSGKGVPAALFMVIAKTLIKDYAQLGATPDQVFAQANEKLCESNEEGLFVTAWLGILEITSGHMTFVNAGHNPPLIYKKQTGFTYLKQKPGFVLAGMEGIQYRCGEFTLEPGDLLYLYTDGVTEAVNEKEELYGEDRLLSVLNVFAGSADGAAANGTGQSKECSEHSAHVLNPKVLLQHLRQDIKEYAGAAPQSDDITMLGLRMNTGKGEGQ